MKRYVEVILKLSERCNIDCKYCYFFNKENKDYATNPPFMSSRTARAFVDFLRSSAPDFKATTFQIDLHGGEPLMMKRERFEEVVTILQDGLREAAAVQFTVQTNALLVDEAWIALLSRLNIYVGVSIDGPKVYHDENRVDKNGAGTYDRTVEKIALIRAAAEAGRIPGFGAICVMNPKFDARLVYDTLTRSLGIENLQFLLPDESHDSAKVADVVALKRFCETLFQCWTEDERGNVRVRSIDRVLDAIMAGEKRKSEIWREVNESVVFTLSSGGDIGHDDTLRNVIPDIFYARMNVADVTFSEFLAWHATVSALLARRSSAAPCRSCLWQEVCEIATRADTPLHRCKDGVADQHTVYCECLKATYIKGAEYLALRGVPVNEISRNFVEIH
ncbi:radical SAM protein [Pandoraea terrigena]|uniref:Anaerobic sulfatase-maturating enzyme n=1 Tax=Pandoraea terrigena TaxID=2508292 RepID=A0A5E4RUV5_9BURK|nr:radical SAM protein [Pandoraea terrigena]VVD65729.1 Anaerobic sulfatase-maturating enzyme [Pandoraea terrigena]